MASMNNPVIENSTMSVLTHVKNHNALYVLMITDS